jgi:glycosyltransferase involved in cell wall biosynthesis
MDGQGPKISVVAPLLNERDNIRPLYEQLTNTLSDRYDYEILFVDDGSTDGGFELLAELHASDPHVRVIRFRKNFGQTAALSAGFAHARGGIIVAIDADLQNDPADIPKMIGKLQEGFDVVSGWRKTRHDHALTRLLPSKIANWLISRITAVRLHDYGCTLKAYRKEILDDTRLYGDMHRFIPALASWSGARISEIVVNHRPRTAGVAKYGLERTWKVILDLMTVKFLLSFSTKPIQLFGGWGILSLLLGSVSGVGLVLMKIFKGRDMTGNPLMYLTILLWVIGIQFILMGLIAELLVRTYHESQGRPTYAIKEVLEAAGDNGDTK